MSLLRHAHALRRIHALAAFGPMLLLLLLAVPACDDDGGGGADSDLVADGSDLGDGGPDTAACTDDDTDCDGVADALDCASDDPTRFPGAPDNAALQLWRSAPVAEDLSFTSEHSALVIDPQGTLHIALVSEREGALYYARSASPGGAGGEFEVEEVAVFDFSPRDAAIAVAPDGTVHITAEDQINDTLRHFARSPSGAWQASVVDSASDTGRHSALAVAPDGAVHLSFVGEGGALGYGQYRGGSWTLSEVVPAGPPGGRSTLVRASDGTLYAALGVAAADGPAVQLAISRDDGQSWQLTALGTADGATGAVSLALAADGAPQLAWHDTGSNSVFLATAAADGGGEWPVEEILGEGGQDLSLALAPDATPYLAFKVGSDLAWAWRAPDGTWQRTFIDESGETGIEPTLAIAPDGSALHIVFGANGGLQHATSALPDGIDQNCDGLDGIDDDGDGFASRATGGADCSDSSADFYPGADDPFDDGLDQNCDGTDGVDADGDGHASVDSGGADCDDANPLHYPRAVDEIGDGVDQSCDGIDGEDRDGDGHASERSGGTDCDDRDASTYVGATDPFGDDEDQNCDGVDGTDADADGHANATEGGTDCNDADPTIWPGTSDNFWQVQTLLPDMQQSHDTSVRHVAAALAPDGQLGIVTSGTSVHYFELAPDGALSETLITDDFWGRRPGLAFDALGQPHIAYVEGFVELHYATRDATGTWTREAIEPGEMDANDYDPRLVLGPAGEVHVAWSENFTSSESALRHAVRNPDGTWLVDPVDGDVSVYHDRLAFELDSLGRPMMLVREPMRLVRREASGTWVHEPVGDAIGIHSDLALDADDTPHVILQGSNFTFLYRTRPAGGGAWSELEIEPHQDDARGARGSIVTDDTGRPHVFWLRYGANGHQMRYATLRPDGTFGLMIADAQGTDLDGNPALVVAPDGTLHALYIDDSRALKYARTGAAPDGIDQNCDGVDGIDDDGDGLASLATGGVDCDDYDPAVGDCS